MTTCAVPAADHAARVRATAAGIGAILLWCFSGVCNAVGSRALGTMPYLAISSATGVLTIAILYLLKGRSLVQLLRVPRYFLLAGFFGIPIYSFLFIGALEMAEQRDLGQVVLVNYLWPIGIVLLGVLLLRPRPRVAPVLVGALLGFTGVALARGLDLSARPLASYLPHLMTLVGALLWSLYSVLLRYWRIPDEQGGSTLQFLILALLAAILATLRGTWPPFHELAAFPLILSIAAGVGPVGFGYYWWELAMKRGSVHLVALLAYFIPIASAVLIGLVYREALSPLLLVGATLITLGALVGRRSGDS